MNDPQTSADNLGFLEQKLIGIVEHLLIAIDVRTKFTNELSTAKAQVEKLEHQKKLIEQQIMNEKKRIDAER